MSTEAKFVSWLKSNATKRVCLDFSIPSLRSRTGLDLVAIHGNLCLGLRHPDNTGPTRQIADNAKSNARLRLSVIAMIERILQDTGMENDVIAEIHQACPRAKRRVEAEETMRLIEAKRRGRLA